MTLRNYHGTSGGYTNHNCRCKKCRAAWSASRSRIRAVNKKQGTESRRITHGTESSYNYGCRCESCTAAHAAYHREYMRRRRAGELAA